MAKLSSEPDTTLYSVDIRLQVGSIAGDPEYHVRMTWSEIEKILRGQAACIRLPSHYGPATEYRFVPLNN
ncbi:hypothetical protein ACMWP8_29005, partial [Escherichia coli]|uniref:hypothetical protein n=1 Tax=Escherichia coli TaxID=562 RepID=UPI0039E0F13D